VWPMLNDRPIFVVMMRVLAPFLAEIPIGVRTPVVVLEVLLGILVGPHVLGVVDPQGSGRFLSSMQAVGTAAVLFMAGMEIDFRQIRGHRSRLA